MDSSFRLMVQSVWHLLGERDRFTMPHKPLFTPCSCLCKGQSRRVDQRANIIANTLLTALWQQGLSDKVLKAVL
jgi:hypothetical protein